MANSIVFHYLMIITIASSISSISGRYGHPPLLDMYRYDMVGLDNLSDEEMSENEYQYVRPQNPEPSSRKLLMDAENRQLEKFASRPESRIARYLEDNNIICEFAITKGYFKQEGYEFFPSEYINKTCIYSRADPFKTESNGITKPEVCLHNDNDFGCQTLFEELNVLKRNVNGNKHGCWEHIVQPVAVGCKCNIHFTY